MVVSKSLKTVQCGGASIVNIGPIFSSDSRFLIVASGLTIQVYSVESGDNVQVLSGHLNEVTGLCQHPKNLLQIMSSSLDGTLRIWDYEDGVLLKTIDVREKILHVLSHPSFVEHILYCANGGESTCVNKFSLTTQEKVETLVRKIEYPKKMCIGVDASYIACANLKSVVVSHLKRTKISDESTNIHECKQYGSVVCITPHPTKKCFATGHASGIICLWRNIVPQEAHKIKNPVISVFHWHSSLVGGVVFTVDASFMLSVGGEGVVVQWHYKKSDKKRDFFPRIGHEMNHISVAPNGQLYATSHTDNSIQLISNMLETKQVIGGFTSAQKQTTTGKLLHCGLQYDWGTQSCVTNGKYGHLLFYRPDKEYQLYNLDIVGQNYIKDLKLEHITYIAQVAFSPKLTYEGDKHQMGRWMATIEERVVKQNLEEQKLKIWKFDETEQRWSLLVLVNLPHKSVAVKAMFQPMTSATRSERALSLVTAAKDGLVKKWSLSTEEDEANVTRHVWRCSASASYCGQPLTDFDISQDGSLLAAAYSNAVCTTNLDNMFEMTEVVTVLPPLTNCAVSQLQFGRFSCHSLILLKMNGALMVYDNLSQCFKKHIYYIDADLVCQDPYSDVAAIFSKDHKVTFIRPSSPSPIATVDQSVSERGVAAACFVPSCDLYGHGWLNSNIDVDWMSKSRVFYVNKDMTVHSVCTEEEIENKLSSSSSSALLRKTDDNLQTPLASLLKNSTKSSRNERKDDLNVVSHKTYTMSIKKLIETPCHLLPSINSLSYDMITSLLVSKKDHELNANETTTKDEEEMEVDSTRNQEEEEQVKINSFKFIEDIVWE